MYTNGSMIPDEAINNSASSAKLVKDHGTTRFTIAFTHDTLLSVGSELWRVILTCDVVPKNLNLIIHLDGQSVVYC
jgi:hypothetical protein